MLACPHKCTSEGPCNNIGVYAPGIVLSVHCAYNQSAFFLPTKKELPSVRPEVRVNKGKGGNRPTADHHLPARQCGITWGDFQIGCLYYSGCLQKG